MPGNLLRYSGLITKIRAMSGGLLTRDEINILTELTTVNEAVAYLKGKAAYGEIYRSQDEVWHRGQAEALIINSLYYDFKRLYQFSNMQQREVLKLVFFRYEVDILKICLKYVFQADRKFHDGYLDSFFIRHVRFSAEELKHAFSIAEFEHGLSNTPYQAVLRRLGSREQISYGEYAQQLDIFYYTSVYKGIKRRKRSPEKELLLTIFGTQIDWLNIMWIYRSKRYFQRQTSDIHASLIPVCYRLKQAQIDGMVKAADAAEMVRILGQSAYFKGKESFVQMEDEISYRTVIDRMYRLVSRKYPASMAPVLKYISDKEQEAERLTTILEGIRYQIDPGEIKDMILVTV